MARILDDYSFRLILPNETPDRVKRRDVLLGFPDVLDAPIEGRERSFEEHEGESLAGGVHRQDEAVWYGSHTRAASWDAVARERAPSRRADLRFSAGLVLWMRPSWSTDAFRITASSTSA